MDPIKILKKFFTSPIVLIIIALVCIYAYFKSNEENKNIAKGLSATVCADSTKKVVSTLVKATRSQDSKNYLLLAKGLTNKGDFKGRSIPNGTSVTILDTLETNSEIVQIYIQRDNPTRFNPRNEYLWIWEGFLCK